MRFNIQDSIENRAKQVFYSKAVELQSALNWDDLAEVEKANYRKEAEREHWLSKKVTNIDKLIEGI